MCLASVSQSGCLSARCRSWCWWLHVWKPTRCWRDGSLTLSATNRPRRAGQTYCCLLVVLFKYVSCMFSQTPVDGSQDSPTTHRRQKTLVYQWVKSTLQAALETPLRDSNNCDYSCVHPHISNASLLRVTATWRKPHSQSHRFQYTNTKLIDYTAVLLLTTITAPNEWGKNKQQLHGRLQ